VLAFADFIGEFKKMAYSATTAFSQTALAKSVEGFATFTNPQAYPFKPWLAEQNPGFSASPVARHVQEAAAVLSVFAPHMKNQSLQRYRSDLFKGLLQVYPHVLAQSPKAAREMKSVFATFGTKKVQRQFEGLENATAKRVETVIARKANALV